MRAGGPGRRSGRGPRRGSPGPGLAFPATSRPRRFKESIQTLGYVDSSGHVHCVSPLLYETGHIPFTLSMDNGRSFPRSGTWLAGEPHLPGPWPSKGTCLTLISARLACSGSTSPSSSQALLPTPWHPHRGTGGGLLGSPSKVGHLTRPGQGRAEARDLDSRGQGRASPAGSVLSQQEGLGEKIL